MSRIYANNVDADIRASLNVLVDNSTPVGQYKDAFVSLGYRLAERFMAEYQGSFDSRITVAVTAEDADYLAKGFIKK